MDSRGTRRGRGRALTAGAAVAAAAVVAGGLWLGAQRAAPPTAASPSPVAAQSSLPPVLVADGASGTSGTSVVPWSAPLRLSLQHGRLSAVQVSGPDGPVAGATGADGSWTSSGTLVPSASYSAVAQVADEAGRAAALDLVVRTTAAARVLHATLAPGDDAVVGVGAPLAVTFDEPVRTAAARALVLNRLSVQTTPSQPGAWRWLDDRTVHYRAPSFWKAGTKVVLRTDLARLQLPDGTWGSGVHSTRFSVGDAVISTVDVQRHTMVVRRNGQVLRTLPVSAGRPGFDTRDGTFIVLEKFADITMDSATVNLPPGTPAYKTKVKDAVRITNSGTFVHGAPWSVASQGSANVSHGCVNISPADAQWFFDLSRYGDVVQVLGSPVGPTSFDAGSRDWNTPYAQWAA